MFARIWQADKYTVAQGTGLSQQAVPLKRSPIANTFADGVPALYRLQRKAGHIVTALKKKIKEKTPSR